MSRRPDADDQIIHADVVAEPPGAVEDAVAHADRLFPAERRQGAGDFLGLHELFELVGAFGGPFQEPFGGADGEGSGFGRAVDRGQDQEAAGPDQGGDGLEEAADVGDVLDDFKRDDEIGGFGAAGGHGLDAVDGESGWEALRCGLRLRRADGFRAGVNAGDGGAQPGEGQGRQTAAAADVVGGQALQGRAPGGLLEVPQGGVADESHADRAHAVQGRESPIGGPPVCGHGGELRQLGGVYAGSLRGRRFLRHWFGNLACAMVNA